MRFATIGTGNIVKHFLEAALRVPGMEYAAVYSRKFETAQAFAKEYGVDRCFTSLQELAEAEDIDGVYIASPNACHCEQAVALLSAGKHVLCEKPIAANGRELKRMEEAAAMGKAVLLEAMRPVYDEGFTRLEQSIKKIGRIRQAVFQFCQYSSRYDNFKAGIIENAFQPGLSNAALLDIGVYCVHPMVRLFGMPEEIRADSIFLKNGFEGAGTILARYDGFQVTLLYSKINAQNTPCQIQGEEGTLLFWDMPDIKRIHIHYLNGQEETIEIQKDSNNMLYEIKLWKQLIEEGADAKPYLTHSKWELAVMDEARKQTGVRFPVDGE